MSDDEDNSEKEHDATPQKLEEARRRGEVPQGRDLAAAAGYAGLLLAALAMGADGLLRLGAAGSVLLDQADSMAGPALSRGAAPFAGLLGSVALGVGALFALPFVAVLAMLGVQRAIVFAPEKLMPKLSRISPISGAQNKFGRAGLFEFAKSAIKLIAVSGVLALFLVARIDPILATVNLDPAVATTVLLRLLVEFLAIILILQLVVGVIDMMWQHHDHLRKHRMSRKELMDELKRSEGDPYVKAQRRQRGIEIATNRMLSDVAKADVVVVNPTHYAVALRWDKRSGRAPVCVAKGVDAVAARIRERAAEAGVPIHRDPPTARALHATVEIGAEIEVEHYRAVAAAIRFAEAIRMRARARGKWGKRT